MAVKLTPVDHDPFATTPRGVKLTPVDGDPFAAAPNKEGAVSDFFHNNPVGRKASALYSGGVEGVSSLVKAAGQLGDMVAQGVDAEGAATGYVTNPATGARMLVPAAVRPTLARVAKDSTPTVSPYTDPAAAAVKRHAGRVEPVNRTTSESVLHGVGEVIPALGAAIANPVLGAGVFGTQGFGLAHDDAIRHGAGEVDAQRAGLQNFAVQGGLSMLPFGNVVGRLAGKAAPAAAKAVSASPVGKAVAELTARAGGDAVMGGGMKAGENVIAQANYDPDRKLGEGVAEAAATMAAGGGLLHVLAKSPAGVKAMNDFWKKRGVDPATVDPAEVTPEHRAEMEADPHIASVLDQLGIKADNPNRAKFAEKVGDRLARQDAKAEGGTIAATASTARAERSAAEGSHASATEAHARAPTPETQVALEGAKAKLEAATRAEIAATEKLDVLSRAVGADLPATKTPLRASGSKADAKELGRVRDTVARAQNVEPGQTGYVDPATIPVRDAPRAPEVLPVTPEGQAIARPADAAARERFMAEAPRAPAPEPVRGPAEPEREQPAAEPTTAAPLAEPATTSAAAAPEARLRDAVSARLATKPGTPERADAIIAEAEARHDAGRPASTESIPDVALHPVADNAPAGPEPGQTGGDVRRDQVGSDQPSAARPAEAVEAPPPRPERAATEEELGRRYEQAQQERAAPEPEPEAKASAPDKPLRVSNTPAARDGNGRFPVGESGRVVSSKGGPIVFPDQKTAAKWVLREGHSKSSDQVFDIANHPSKKGKFTVVERGRAEPARPKRAEYDVHRDLSDSDMAVLAGHYGRKSYDGDARAKFAEDVKRAISDGIEAVAEAVRHIVRKAVEFAKKFAADESGSGPNPFERKAKPEAEPWAPTEKPRDPKKPPPAQGPRTKPLSDAEAKTILGAPHARRALPTMDRLRAEARDTADMWTEIVGNPKEYPRAIRRSWDTLMSSNGQGLRIIADAHQATNPEAASAVRWLSDQLATDPGSGRVISETWERAVQGHTGQMMNRAVTILGEVRDAAFETRVVDIMSGRARAAAGSREESVVRRLRAVMDDQWKYLSDGGLEPGYVRQNYFPRVIDTAKVLTKEGRAGFMAAAEKLYTGMGFTKTGEAAGMAQAWMDRILGISDNIAGASMPHSDATKGRVLPPDADKILAPYLNTDLRAGLGDYFRQTTRAAEATKRFGANGEKFVQVMNAVAKSDMSVQEFQQIQGHFHSSTGYMYRGMKESGPIANGVMSTWGVLAFLPRAAWSSLVEGSSIGVRSNDWTKGVTGMVDSFRELTALRKNDDAAATAEFLGIIGDSANDLFMSARAGVDPTGKGTRQLINGFFKANLLTQLTEAQRIVATRVGRGLIRQLVREVATGHERAKSAGFMLRDMGVDEAGARALHKVFEDNGGVPLPLLATRGGPVELYKGALRRFVDEAIQNPTAADRPMYANHPYGRAAYSLMSFVYSNTKNVTARAAKGLVEATKPGYTVDDRMRLLNPVIGITVLSALQAAVADVRDRVTNPNARAERTKAQYMGTLASRANVFGNYDNLVNLGMSWKYSRSFQSLLTGAYQGGFLDDAAKMASAIPGAPNNSDITNNAEWNGAKAAYHFFATPAAGALAASIPTGGSPLVRAAVYGGLQTATAPGVSAWAADQTVGTRTIEPKKHR